MQEKAKAPTEFWTSERCYITELINDPALPDVSVARCRVEAGVTTELHALAVMEWYLIETGSGLMRVGDAEPFPVGPADSVRIDAGVAQQITNTGADDLIFSCVCVPRFTADCYRSLE